VITQNQIIQIIYMEENQNEKEIISIINSNDYGIRMLRYDWLRRIR